MGRTVSDCLIHSGFELERASNIWRRPHFNGIAYSDGEDVEWRVGAAIADATDLSILSAELRKCETDWASRYHLSGSRANLLRPFKDLLSGDVLEIGSGCGALTRFLGECGGNVLALEGTLRRAAIARSRTRDQSNVTVVAEKLDHFDPEMQFDVVTLIGVLEYASVYSGGRNPALTLLKQAKSLLKPQGRLILAIENQLGLKYFAGAPEDHIGGPMYGVEGRYRANEPRTFGRKVLANLLEEAGFADAYFMAPFPDYKFPVSIVTQRGFEARAFDAAAFAWQSVHRDQQFPSVAAFAPERVWPQVIENGLGLDMANSFLVCASPVRREEAAFPLAFHYSTERLPQYCREAIFVDRASGEIDVVYKLLLPESEGVEEGQPLRLKRSNESRYVQGTPLSWRLLEVVTRDGWTPAELADFLAYFVDVVDELHFATLGTRIEREMGFVLPGTFFDVLPQNVIIDRLRTPIVIDEEWDAQDGIELGHLLLRTLLSVPGMISRFGKPHGSEKQNRKEFLFEVFEAFGHPLSEIELSRFLEAWSGAHHQVTGRSPEEFLEWGGDLLLQTRNLSRVSAESSGLHQRLGTMQAVLSQREGQVQVLEERLVETGQLLAGSQAEEVKLRAAVEEAQERACVSAQEAKAARQAASEAQDATNIARQAMRRLQQEAESAKEAGECLRQALSARESELHKLLRRSESQASETQAVADELLRSKEKLAAAHHMYAVAERLQLTARDEADDLIRRLKEKEAEDDYHQYVIDALKDSTSWRLTAPLRSLKQVAIGIGRVPVLARYQMGVAARWIWPRLPLSPSLKSRLKSAAFSKLPFLFASSRAFRDWRTLRDLDGSADARFRQASASQGRGDLHDDYVPLQSTAAPVGVPAKIICFYLPQFHPIPENDAWWGRGFTEWMNVKPATPQFEGHYQPRAPDELGYYDLLDRSTQRRQIELAKLHGIGGFCFYFYWFGGKRLLEKPVENYLDDRSLDLPFCLCWANENWSRRWDGLDTEILMAQSHSPDDDIAFIAEVAPYLRDPRYIRVDGRPLLLVYRPNLLPSARATGDRWRKWCRENGIGEIYLAYTQSFEAVDPATYGFDAAIEFPPNNSAPPLITDTVRPITEDCQVTVYDWRIFPLRSTQYDDPGYTLFRSVCPSWDNTARRGSRGTVFLHNTPDLYRLWLTNAIADTCLRFANSDQRLVFVNAWNEWAEGAYLEPDRRYGYAYLQATRDAVEATSDLARRRIVVVAHDAHPHGAQFLSLYQAVHFRKDLGFAVDLISLGDGPLLEDYGQAATLHRIDAVSEGRAAIVERLGRLRRQGAEVAIVNTTVSGVLVPMLKEAGFRVVSLIHEMPGVLGSYQLQSHAASILKDADAVVFAADAVRKGFETFTGQAVARAKIRPQGLYLRNRVRMPVERQAVREAVRRELGMPLGAKIVLSVGYADHRKGVDLFVDALIPTMRADAAVHGLWVGHADETLLAAQWSRIKDADLTDRFHFPGRASNPQRFYSAADIFVLAAREDPFPSVVMEAMDAALPVMAFKNAGGFEDLLKRGCGVLVDAFDTGAMARGILSLLADEDRAGALGGAGQAIIDREFSLRHYLFDLLEFAGKPQPKVSVIVPNYNYALFLKDRLRTIVQQSYPIYELIVLDDASTDESPQVIEEWLKDCDIPHVFLRNTENSGSVLHQWRRGVEEARGDLVWIAEADDLADPEFVENVVRAFDDPETVMSFAQSRQMAADGGILCEHYLDYVADVDPVKWTAPYNVGGREEISRGLFMKNTIPNVSAVMFRRDALRAALTAHKEDILSYRNAGDWVTYLRILEEGGSIAFCPRALNSHRRHQQSLTVGNFNLRQLQEIVRVQRDTIRRMNLDGDARARADAYSQKLYEQFNLASVEYPGFGDHPGLKAFNRSARGAI